MVTWVMVTWGCGGDANFKARLADIGGEPLAGTPRGYKGRVSGFT